MSLKTSVSYDVQVGFENDLNNLAYQRSRQELNDALDSIQTTVISLDANEQNVPIVSKVGAEAIDVKFIYVEADGAGGVDLSQGSAVATAAVLTGSGGTFPTGFAGGETWDITLDGVLTTVTFLVADQLLNDVVNRINSTFTGLGRPAIATAVGELVLTSTTTGSGSNLTVENNAVATTLGFTGGATDTGDDPTAGTVAWQLRPMIPGGGQQAEAKAFLMAAITMTGDTMFLSNPSTTAAVTVRVAFVGDVTTVVC